MDFESPDVEKEFPGLYASESAKKSNESDFSDDGGHEKHSKKELLGGKRKDKKDRKDRGYATLAGESSPDEDQETKSPSKSKKTKAFKFPSSKKEKREKSKLKSKDKNKKGLDISEEQPIFGVSLALALERSRCHDGVDLPLIVRDCIDYVEECGMTIENLYKAPAVKSKIQQLKKLYNQREFVNITEFEPSVAANLLILFLRELPEPILENSETITKFEQAASTKEVAQRESQLTELVEQLENPNKTLLAWMILHLDHVTSREKTTKMNAQTLAMTLSPVMQMSHRLLVALLFHCKALFPNVELTKYVPPLSSGSINLPDTPETIRLELGKQESLLSQIHMQMNAGFVTKSREEQLWEVQRMITQLKRKYKTVEKSKSLDEEKDKEEEEEEEEVVVVDGRELDLEEIIEPERVDTLREMLIYEELLNMQALLKSRIVQENFEIKRLNGILAERAVGGGDARKSRERSYSPNEAEMTAMVQLSKENQLLEKKMTTLIRSIIEEKDACVELRVQLAVQKITNKQL